MIGAQWNPPAKAEPAAPAPPAAAPEPPKPAEAPTTATPPPEPAKAAPAAKKDFTDAEIDDGLKKHPDANGWKVVSYLRKKFNNSEAVWKSEKAALEARPQTPANDARIEQLQKLIDEKDGEVKTVKQRMAELDFTRSDEYSTRFVQPYNNELKRALEEVKGLTVTFQKDGEPQTRQATENDFQKAMKLPPDEQDNFIHDAFGRSAHRVINRINELSRIRAASEQAIADHSANFEKTKTERELAQKREQAEYDKHFSTAHDELKANPEFGSYVSENEADPEGSQIFKAELEKFDDFKTSMQSMTPKEAAATAALVRARFAAEPRRAAESKRDKAEIASLKAELAKLRGADPGGPIKTAVSAAPVEQPAGIDGMMGKMDWGKK